MTLDSESPSTILAESGGVQLIHRPDSENGDFSVVNLPGSGGNVGRDVHIAVLVDPQDRSDAAVQWHGTPGSAPCTAWFSVFDDGYDVVEFRASPTPLVELEVHNEADFVQTRSEWRLMTGSGSIVAFATRADAGGTGLGVRQAGATAAMTMRDGRLRRVRHATAAGVIPGQRLPFTVGELYAQYMPPMPTGFAKALRTESEGSDYARIEFQGSWLCVEWGAIVDSR